MPYDIGAYEHRTGDLSFINLEPNTTATRTEDWSWSITPESNADLDSVLVKFYLYDAYSAGNECIVSGILYDDGGSSYTNDYGITVVASGSGTYDFTFSHSEFSRGYYVRISGEVDSLDGSTSAYAEWAFKMNAAEVSGRRILLNATTASYSGAYEIPINPAIYFVNDTANRTEIYLANGDVSIIPAPKQDECVLHWDIQRMYNRTYGKIYDDDYTDTDSTMTNIVNTIRESYLGKEIWMHFNKADYADYEWQKVILKDVDVKLLSDVGPLKYESIDIPFTIVRVL